MDIKCATSFDERFDPKNVLDGNMKNFWVTTGLYPQELLIELKQPRQVNEVQFKTSGGKYLIPMMISKIFAYYFTQPEE